MVDFKLLEYRDGGKLVIADEGLRERLLKFGLRELMRKTELSQKTLYAILRGKPVRERTLETLKQRIMFT